jgi:hypothetical protein
MVPQPASLAYPPAPRITASNRMRSPTQMADAKRLISSYALAFITFPGHYPFMLKAEVFEK